MKRQTYRVRGGSWEFPRKTCSSCYSDKCIYYYVYYDVGFRLILKKKSVEMKVRMTICNSFFISSLIRFAGDYKSNFAKRSKTSIVSLRLKVKKNE